MENQTLSARIESALEALAQCRRAKTDWDLWSLAFSGRWAELAEETRGDMSARTPQGIVAELLLRLRERPKNNPKKHIATVESAWDHLRAEAESGRNIRAELSPDAEEFRYEWTRDAKRRRNKAERDSRYQTDIAQGKDLGNSAVEPSCGAVSPPTLARVVLASPRDPLARHDALSAHAEKIRAELPPPMREGEEVRLGQQSLIGQMDPTSRADWIAWLDAVARRWAGPLTAQDIHRMSGAPARWCAYLLAEWRALLGAGISLESRRALASSLGAEAEAISREALALASQTDDERLKGNALKLALDANARRASLAGLDKISLDLVVRSSGGSIEAQMAELGIDAESLRRIGELASNKMGKS